MLVCYPQTNFYSDFRAVAELGNFDSLLSFAVELNLFSGDSINWGKLEKFSSFFENAFLLRQSFRQSFCLSFCVGNNQPHTMIGPISWLASIRCFITLIAEHFSPIWKKAGLNIEAAFLRLLTLNTNCRFLSDAACLFSPVTLTTCMWFELSHDAENRGNEKAICEILPAALPIES